MNTALVAIAKNEDNYIEEWIRYNLKVGFSKIFIFQNDWKLKITPYIQTILDKLELIEWNGEHKIYGNPQLDSYNFFIDKYYNEYDWAAFFDVDEFIYMKNISLNEFLNKYNSYKSISIRWRLFGDSNLIYDPNTTHSVIDRFQMSGNELEDPNNFGKKTMINLKLSKNTLKINGHESVPEKPILVDDNDAEIAHYLVKTKFEFIKRRCGTTDFFYGNIDDFKKSNMENVMKFFDGKNKNEIKNTSIFDFFHS